MKGKGTGSFPLRPEAFRVAGGELPEQALNNIKFNEVNYSEAELNQTVEDISKDRSTLAEKNISLSSVSSNEKENMVEVGIEPYSSETETYLKETYGENMINVMNKEKPKEESRTQDYWYMYGGLQIANTSANSTGSSGYCSNGFSLDSSDGYFIVTAGHCTDDWSSFYQGGKYKGSVYLTDKGGSADVGVVKLDSDRTTNSLYRYDFGDRDLTSYQLVNSDYVGQQVAKTGARTGVTTGEIQSRSWSGYISDPNGDSVYYTNLRDASYDSAGGDSGGTIYWGNELRGLHTGSNGKFSHIHYTLQKIPGTPTLD
ncbi:S1 family peptidase [Jeotgalibacillus proteolyticus]|uniref:S1 family peptidase n=1 Tax=Jeotgalibacillus proteolyticus TaxID=2082395 RepID=UPI003CF41F8D